MELLQTILGRFEIARDLLRFFWRSRWWWMTPLLVALLIFSILVVLAETSAVAPLIYTLF